MTSLSVGVLAAAATDEAGLVTTAWRGAPVMCDQAQRLADELATVHAMAPGNRELAMPLIVLAAPTLPPQVASSWLQRAGAVVGNLVVLVGLVFCIPFVLMAIGAPIALLLNLLLWIKAAI